MKLLGYSSICFLDEIKERIRKIHHGIYDFAVGTVNYWIRQDLTKEEKTYKILYDIRACQGKKRSDDRKAEDIHNDEIIDVMFDRIRYECCEAVIRIIGIFDLPEALEEIVKREKFFQELDDDD